MSFKKLHISICRFVDYISFSFEVKYIWKKCYNNFFRCIFLGARTIKTVPKHIWMRHWSTSRLWTSPSHFSTIKSVMNVSWKWNPGKMLLKNPSILRLSRKCIPSELFFIRSWNIYFRWLPSGCFVRIGLYHQHF